MCRATSSDFVVLKSILYMFENISGLGINYSKSNLFYFGKSLTKGAALAKSLNCSLSSPPFTYLGIPLKKGSLTKQDWQPLLDKMNKKLSMWKSRQQSIGGSLTLINSVLTSIPLYYLSFFKLPTWLIKAMDKLRRNFLWGGSESCSPLKSLVKWPLVCKPKKVGGLGILNINDFNLALLSKWMWEVLHNKSLIGRVFNSVYNNHHPSHRNTPPSQTASRFWRESFFSSQAMRSLILWRLGRGSEVRFWEDKWTGCNSLASLFPAAYNLALSQNVSARSQGLQLHNVWRWKPLIRRPISDRECASVQALNEHLSNTAPSPNLNQDEVHWPHHPSGSFSVKSMYSIISGINTKDKVAGFIWNSVIPSKVKVFLWILLKRKLNTKLLLSHKGWQGDVKCSLCNTSPESDEHIFLSCPFTAQVWSYFSPFMQQPPLPTDFSQIIDYISTALTNAEDRHLWSILFPSLCWCVWRARNNTIFRGIKTSPRELAANISHFMILWTGKLASKKAAVVHNVIMSKGIQRLLLKEDPSSVDLAQVGDNF